MDGGRGGRGRRAPLPGAQGDQYGFYFDPSRHDFSDQIVLGRSYSGGAGIAAGEQALDVLARAPATARHLSYQLAQYFVADNPPQALVARMAERYRAEPRAISARRSRRCSSAPSSGTSATTGPSSKLPTTTSSRPCALTGAPEITNYRPLFGTMTLLGMAPYCARDARRLCEHARGVAQPGRDDDAAELRDRARAGPSAAARAAVRGGRRRRRRFA